MTERRASAAAPADVTQTAPTPHRLQIVVDGHPATPAAPLEVMPARTEPTPPAIPPTLTPQPVAPIVRPAIAAPAPHKAALTPLIVAAVATPHSLPSKAAPSKGRPPAQIRLAKAAPDPKAIAKAHRLALAQAAAAKAAAHKVELAKAAQALKAVRLRQIELAKAEAKGGAVEEERDIKPW